MTFMPYPNLLRRYVATMGQAIMRIRVRTFESLKRIPVHMAYLRLVVKYVLGGISVLTVPGRRDRRAIHDLPVDSIVVDAREATGRARN